MAAQVPQLTTPRVAPSTQPQPLQSVQAPSEAFGVNVVAQAATDLGQTADQHSANLEQYALQYQALNNKVAADSSTTDAVGQIDTLRSAYQEQHKQSLGAVDNLGDFYSHIDGIVDKGRQGLSLPAQTDFDSAVRRYAAGAKSEMVTWANGQRSTAITNATNAKLAVTGASAAAHPDNPEFQAAYQQSVGDAAATLGQLNNWGPDEAKAFVQQHIGAVATSQIHNAVDGGDVQTARKLFDANVDNMTEPQVTQALGELKAATISQQATQDGMLALTGVPTPPVVTAKPTAPWDAGVAAIRASPQDAIAQLLGQPVTVTSGARDAATNAAVGGAPSSEHLTGNAWDFIPSRGNLTAAAATLATNLHAANVPFDQIEVDQSNGHVHVGFGPKNRNEIIDQHGNELPQGTELGAQPAPALPPVSPTTEPDAYNVAATNAAIQWVQQRYPGNTVQQERSLAAMESSINLRTRQIKTEQDANYVAALGTITDTNAQDISAVPPSQLAQMSASQVISLKNATKANANELTESRVDTANTLKWQAQQNPAEFVQLDLKNPNLDLTRTERSQMMQLQITTQKTLGKGPAINTLATQALNSVQGQQTLAGLGITDKKSPEYAQLAGAMQAEIEKAAGPENKPVSQKDLNALLSQAAARQGAKPPAFSVLGLNFGGSAGTPSFQVPDSERAAIVSSYAKRGVTPTERDIAYTYQKARNRAP